MLVMFLLELALFNSKVSQELDAFVIAAHPNLSGFWFGITILLLESTSISFVMSNKWKLFGKLTYGLYLVHPIVLVGAMFYQKKVLTFGAFYFVSCLAGIRIFDNLNSMLFIDV
jgi:peptidoglycan/LPS O-acetylase OafA/YrhL